MSVKYLVFISYRRADSIHIADRIYEHLKSHFGKENIFKDVDNISLGLDFRQIIDEAVGSCRVLIAIIGKDWLDIKNEQGRRLDNPTDFVRIEIESALRRGIPVIPVLVDDAQMPLERDLPTTLQGLTDHNGIKIRPDPDFQNDMKRLTNGIKSLSGRFYLVERLAWWFSFVSFLFCSFRLWKMSHFAWRWRFFLGLFSADLRETYRKLPPLFGIESNIWLLVLFLGLLWCGMGLWGLGLTYWHKRRL